MDKVWLILILMAMIPLAAAGLRAKFSLDSRPRFPEPHGLPAGSYSVVQTKVPAHLIRVIKELRTITGWDLRSAKWATERPQILSGVSREAADEVAAIWRDAGGEASVVDSAPAAAEVRARPGSTSRCPYCHEDAGQDVDEVVACASCLARHHEPCWDEHRQCAGCGHNERFSKVEATEGRDPRPQRGKERA